MAEFRRSMQRQDESLWDRCWKDEDGKVIIWQFPNIPLIAWLILTLLSIFTTDLLSNIFWYAALIALASWCGLEIFKGVNYFRRILGVVVLLMTIAAVFKVGY